MFDPLILSSDVVSSLISQWLALRKSKKEEELATEEWKQLETAYMEHLKWRFQYPTKIFGQQRAISWILTFLVLVLIISGLAFSLIQLNAAIKLGDLSSLSTDIKVQSASKLSMSSSIVGAVVLIISLLFFNLYLKHVFQIRYPTPPHVGLSDTDAANIWEKVKNRVNKKSEPKHTTRKANKTAEQAADSEKGE